MALVTGLRVGAGSGPRIMESFEKMIDNIEKEKNKAKPISGPTNFNMGISSSLSW